jgi:hypothetical protein
MNRVLLLALLALAGCSGVSRVCDKSGICLETWRDGGSLSTVTASRLLMPDGEPVKGAVTATSGGIVGFIDPFASGVATTATDAKAVGAW